MTKHLPRGKRENLSAQSSARGGSPVLTILLRWIIVSYVAALALLFLAYTSALVFPNTQVIADLTGNSSSKVLGVQTSDDSLVGKIAKAVLSPLGKFNLWLIKLAGTADQVVDPLVITNLNDIFEYDSDGNIVVKKQLIFQNQPLASGVASWDNIQDKPSLLSSINSVEGDAGNIKLVEGNNIQITSDKDKNKITIAGTLVSSSPGVSTVNLTAGTGISVSGSSPSFTVANTDLGSGQFIFKNVAVSGQSTVVADRNSDTLTFAAGAGITLTTAYGTDTLTISSTGGAVSFDAVTAGTNTEALVIGAGGSLTVSGSGTITATNLVAGSSVVSDAEVDDDLTITAAGSVAAAAVTGTLTDAQISDTLTIDGTGSVAWSALSGYPSACAAGTAVTTLADSPTCSSFWNSTNDGAGSGLDADLLDGISSASFVQTSRSLTAGAGLTGGGDLSADRTFNVVGGSGITANADNIELGSLTADWNQTAAFDIVLNNASSELKILESVGAAFYGIFDVGDLAADQTYTFTNGGTVWTSGNDGTGSGLDADTLDGSDSTAFSPVAGSASITTVGALTSGSIAAGFGTIATSNSITGTILTASTAASGLVIGSGATATTLSSTATAARAISFPNEAGTICLQGSGSCGFSVGANYWTDNTTYISPNTLTSGEFRIYDNGSLNIGGTTAPGGTGRLIVSGVNAASGSADALTLTGTLGNFDGTDTFRGLYLNYTNGTHSGSNNVFNAIDIANLATPGISATETAINIGSGWDDAININSSALIAETTGAVFIDPTTTGTFLDFELATQWTTGTLINADFASATTQTGAITGVDMNFGSNLTVNTSTITGFSFQPPTFTATNKTVTGFNIPSSVASISSAGTTNWNGVSIALPKLNSLTGTINATGVSVTIPDDAIAQFSGTATMYGINVQTTGSTGAPGGTVYGVNIANTTAGGATQTALNIGTGWDKAIDANGFVEVDLSNSTSSTEAVCGTVGSENSANSILDDCTTSVNPDYAEMYAVEVGTTYGHIVAAGSEYITTEASELLPESYRLVKLVKSTKTDNKLVGIVSNNYSDFTSTGYNIKQEDNPMPVALVGRVPTFVSLENGPIEVGDPITASSIPGVGMKATESGPVVGTALAAMDDTQCQADGNGACTQQLQVFVNVGWYVAPLETVSGQLETNLDVQTLTAGTIHTQVLFVGDKKISLTKNGKLKIDADVEINGELFANKLNVSDEAAGSSTLAVGKTKIFVETSLLTDKSQVLITLNTLTEKAIAVTKKEPGKGFTVEITSPEPQDIDFDWLIIN